MLEFSTRQGSPLPRFSGPARLVVGLRGGVSLRRNKSAKLHLMFDHSFGSPRLVHRFTLMEDMGPFQTIALKPRSMGEKEFREKVKLAERAIHGTGISLSVCRPERPNGGKRTCV